MQKLLQWMSLDLFKNKFHLGKMVFEHILKRTKSNATRVILGLPIFNLWDLG